MTIRKASCALGQSFQETKSNVALLVSGENSVEMNFIFFTRVNCKKLKMLPSTLTGFLFLTRTTSTSTETVEFGGTEPLRLPVDLHQPLSMISYHLYGRSENDNVTMDDNDDMCVDPYAREGPRRRSRFSSVQVPVTVRSRPST